jgi:integrase
VKKRIMPSQVRDAVSTTEAHLVLAAANPKHSAILAVSIYCALRKGAVIALRKQDVNLAKRHHGGSVRDDADHQGRPRRRHPHP